MRKTFSHRADLHSASFAYSQFLHPQKLGMSSTFRNKSSFQHSDLLKTYQEKIHKLTEKLALARKQKQEVEETLKFEAERSSLLLNENNRLYYTQEAVEKLTHSLQSKKLKIKDLYEQVSLMLNELYKSEECISKFSKVVKEKDDMHERSEKLHKDSEVLLKDYYTQKLISCLEKFVVKQQESKVDKDTQTDENYNEAIRDALIQNQQKYISTLKTQEVIKEKYQKLYRNAVGHLKEAAIE
mmetsp:Transcript_19290/g.22383  ORF Transcript_19290/g.22383 Transcript_19290/m.22383 type:complete len:241 (+) Transcript_19290:122-844(+)